MPISLYPRLSLFPNSDIYPGLSVYETTTSAVRTGRQIQYRVIIQKSNGAKYFPQLVDCSTNDQYPFSCPTATVELSTSSTVARQHLSPVRCDDIIRVQWSEKTQSDQKTVWRDLFSGRIMTIAANYADDANINLQCRGHAEEAVYRAITSDYSASSTRTGAMLASIVGTYLSRITDDSGNTFIDSTESTSVASYNIQADAKYVADIIKELETLEDYGYRFRTLPVFDSDGNISAVRAVWEALPSTATPLVKAIQGTDRFKSAYFQSSVDRLVNDVTIYGESGSPQKVGNATDSTSQSSYNTRHHIETDLSLTTDSICSSLATAIKDEFKDPAISGQILLQLSPDLLPGDLLECKVPGIYLNGSTIDDDYRVVRVSHRTKTSQTTVDIGQIVQYPYDILESFSNRLRLGNANLID